MDLCYIGLHDWELLEQIYIPFGGGKYDKKVCLRCGKCLDQITPYLERAKKQKEARIQRRTERRNLANKLWKECNADKTA